MLSSTQPRRERVIYPPSLLAPVPSISSSSLAVTRGWSTGEHFESREALSPVDLRPGSVARFSIKPWPKADPASSALFSSSLSPSLSHAPSSIDFAVFLLMDFTPPSVCHRRTVSVCSPCEDILTTKPVGESPVSVTTTTEVGARCRALVMGPTRPRSRGVKRTIAKQQPFVPVHNVARFVSRYRSR